MTFSLKTMGTINCILFFIHLKTIRKVKNTHFENVKELYQFTNISLYMYILLIVWFFCNCVIADIVSVGFAWQLIAVSVHIGKLAGLFFFMRILFTMVQSLYTKFKQCHFPLKCFKNYSIHENNSYYTMPFTSPPSKKGEKVLKEPPPAIFT